MGKLRVLVVDDSVVVRRIVRNVLDEDSEIKVTGTAANGRIALDKIERLTPDLVTLGLDMPVMSGLEALEEIRRRHPSLPVVMFSAHTERGAAATLEALSLGASDYVHKPSASARLEESLDSVREMLIPKIKALCRTPSVAPRRERVRPAKRRAPKAPVSLVAIGVSTGGPVALTKVLPLLPGDLRAPVVIVQHLPATFTRQLAARLDSNCELEVKEATDGAWLQPGTAWIARGDFHVEVEEANGLLQLRTHQDAPENSCRPAADVLFRSVARHCGPGALAVVLTGMGQDGLRGCEAINDGGGQIVVQDEASSVVWGMPGAVADAELADAVLPLDEIAAEISRLVCNGSEAASPAPPLSQED